MKKIENEKVDIGEKVDLHLGRGPSYRTMVEDIEGQSVLWVSVPYYRGIPIALRRDQGLQLYFYRPNGRFCLDVKVVDFKMSGEVRLIALQVLYGPRKQQRRESFRYRKTLQAVIRGWESGPFPLDPDMEDMLDEERLYTENISETGALLVTKTRYEPGDKGYLRVYLNWPQGDDSPPVELICEVRSCVEMENVRGAYRVGVMFLELGDDVRGHIARYVLVQQQHDIKQKRLVEGEDE